MSLVEIIISWLLVISVPTLAYYKKGFTLPATICVYALLGIIAFIDTHALFYIVIAFTITVVVEKIAHRDDQSSETITKKTGARDTIQLFANGLTALVAIILAFFLKKKGAYIAYCAAIAESLSDSVAAAVGSNTKGKVIDIVSLTEIPRGLSGGISLIGSATCILASVLMGIVAKALFGISIFDASIIAASAIAGCFIDSYLGSCVQVKYICKTCGMVTERETHCDSHTDHLSGNPFFDNDKVNFISNLSSGCIAVCLSLIITHGYSRLLIQCLLCLLIGVSASTIVHELGHVFGCVLTKSRISSVKIGQFVFDVENKALRLKWVGRSRCSFYCKSNKKLFVCTIMGILANLVITIVSIVLVCIHPRYFQYYILICVNVLKVIINLMPNRVNDGHLLIQSIKGW